MSDPATKAFKKFAKAQEFWRRETAERLEPLYRELINAGKSPSDAVDMLNDVCAALRGEYGD